MDCLSLYQAGLKHLIESAIPDPELESSLFLAVLLDVPRSSVLLNLLPCSPEIIACFNSCISRRCLHEPFAYIIGSQEFWSLDFIVTPDVLIPRPETELIIEHVLKWRDPNTFNDTVLDCGTGSGILAVTLATIFKKASFTAIDISEKALAIAFENSCKHVVDQRISFLQADFMQQLPLSEPFDIIVANPPYVDATTFPNLQKDVTCFEPHLALDGKGDGFVIIDHLLRTLGRHLKHGGHLFMEIGFDQQQRVEDVLRSLSFYGQYRIINDYAGMPRMVHAVKQ